MYEIKSLFALLKEKPATYVYRASCCANKGQVLEQIRLASPFLLRSYDPPIEHLKSKTISGFDRIGKRIVFAFEDDLFLVLHLMIAGKLHWRKKGLINRLRDCFKP